MANTGLPTFEKLGVSPPPSTISAVDVATQWLDAFSSCIAAVDTGGLVSLFVADAYWRDLLALTWNFRTFIGHDKIKAFAHERLKSFTLSSFELSTEPSMSPVVSRPYPDVAWIQFMFSFNVASVGKASGLVRLVPQSDGVWRCHCLLTDLEELEGFPELIGPCRNFEPNHGLWESARTKECAFEDNDPTVLIVGAGHAGLMVAARLKCLGIKSLIVDKNGRIGDNWRNRYDALCLHDSVWYDHFPYMPFPSTWPVYTPARKLASWLENYADAMELNVWMSSTVSGAVQQEDGQWKVTIQHAKHAERTFLIHHIVSATGFGATSLGTIKPPEYPGQDKFKGQVLHSFHHKKASDHAGKKVVVVGACTSAHDICADYYHNGVDVTMYQRSSTYVLSATKGLSVLMKGLYEETGPPTNIADKINASYPNLLMEDVGARQVNIIEELDKPLLDGLRASGFKLNRGYNDTSGLFLQAWTKAGGYYIDVGTSQLIIDGKIKLKSGGVLEGYTEDGLLFEDGSTLPADVVVFATGVGGMKDGIQAIVGEEVINKCGDLWGLNEEGELKGVWRDLGVKGLWSVVGNLALCRFYSKHLAMQIKAIEEGMPTKRY